MSQVEEISETLRETNTSKDEKPKREKKEFLDDNKTVHVGTPLFNSLYGFLARECQCRPEITPLKIAGLVQRFVGQVSIVIGENNDEYTEELYQSIDNALYHCSLMKLKEAPSEAVSNVFKYETIRPKRERSESDDGDSAPKSKKSKKSDAEEGEIVVKTKKSKKDFIESKDSEGNVVLVSQ